MLLPDVNVLIYAFRADMAQHERCKAWLDDVLASPLPFGISPLILSAVVRITTNPRVFVEPSTIDEAFSFCDALLAQPQGQPITPGRRHWSIFRDLVAATGTRGPRVSDVWFAALAIEWDCEWVTMDRDFDRFPGLRCRPPA